MLKLNVRDGATIDGNLVDFSRNRDKPQLAGLTQAYMVFRSGGKEDSKHSGATGKFLGKSGRPPGTSNQTNSISLQQGNFTDESDGATVRASLSTVLLDLHPFLGFRIYLFSLSEYSLSLRMKQIFLLRLIRGLIFVFLIHQELNC